MFQSYYVINLFKFSCTFSEKNRFFYNVLIVALAWLTLVWHFSIYVDLIEIVVLDLLHCTVLAFVVSSMATFQTIIGAKQSNLAHILLAFHFHNETIKKIVFTS